MPTYDVYFTSKVPPDERLLLTLGNLVPRKDPLKFVRAVKQVVDSGTRVRAFMVGEGPERAHRPP